MSDWDLTGEFDDPDWQSDMDALDQAQCDAAEAKREAEACRDALDGLS